MPFHLLTNIEINEYYKNEPKFNGVYSRNNLPKIIKKGAYVINLDEYANIGTHWTALFLNQNIKITIKLLKEYLKMNDLELTEVDKYRLNEMNKIKYHFSSEINKRKDIINKLNKYIVGFDYLDKIFITLSASFGTLSIASHATVVGIPVGIAGASLTLIFTIGTGINKSLLQVT